MAILVRTLPENKNQHGQQVAHPTAGKEKEMTLLDVCFHSLFAVCGAAAMVGGILSIVLKVIVIREGSRPYLKIRKRNVAKLRQLFENQNDPARRRCYMLILNMYDTSWYVFVISLVPTGVLFYTYF